MPGIGRYGVDAGGNQAAGFAAEMADSILLGSPRRLPGSSLSAVGKHDAADGSVSSHLDGQGNTLKQSYMPTPRNHAQQHDLSLATD